MPLDADEEWSNDRVMSLTDILKLISAHHEIVPMQRGNAPAARWKYTDGAGEIGVIATVTEAFCESCDRIRLTADRKITETVSLTLKDYDMRNLLRNGATDDDIDKPVCFRRARKVGRPSDRKICFHTPK